MALKDRPGRGGVTVDQRNTQMTLGFWPEHLDPTSPNSWLGQLRREFGATVEIAQKYHTFHETRRINKLKGIAALEPEPAARAATARMQQRKLAQIEANVAKVSHEAFMARKKLQPIDFSGSTVIDALRRQEIRGLLRQMTEEQRLQAMRKYSFREAALEQIPEASGLAATVHEQLIEQELLQKHPDEIFGSQQAAEGVEVVEVALKAAKAAVEAELTAVGEPLVEQSAPEPVKAWA